MHMHNQAEYRREGRNVPYIYAVVSIKYALQYSGQMKIEKKNSNKINCNVRQCTYK